MKRIAVVATLLLVATAYLQAKGPTVRSARTAWMEGHWFPAAQAWDQFIADHTVRNRQ